VRPQSDNKAQLWRQEHEEEEEQQQSEKRRPMSRRPTQSSLSLFIFCLASSTRFLPKIACHWPVVSGQQ